MDWQDIKCAKNTLADDGNTSVSCQDISRSWQGWVLFSQVSTAGLVWWNSSGSVYLGSPSPGFFFLLIFPSCAPRRIMEGRWMTTMTWSLSRSVQGRGEAGRMITSESCWRKTGHSRRRGWELLLRTASPIQACPEQRQEEGTLCRPWFAEQNSIWVWGHCCPQALGDLRLGMILSCCFSWKHFLIFCVLRPLVFHIPFQSWRGVFWLVLGVFFYPPRGA